MELDFRTRTTYTITQTGPPVTLDSELFRNAVPPFEGNTIDDFWDYITDNLSHFEAEDFIEDNRDTLSDDLLDELWDTFVEYPSDLMFDSRTKSDDVIIEGGLIDKEYTKYNGFNAEYNTDY